MEEHLSLSKTHVSQALSQVTAQDSQGSQQKPTPPPVEKVLIQNHLFLDLSSLSKSLQMILSTYQMLVIAKIKRVEKHVATDKDNPYQLKVGQVFYQCQIEHIEHIVGFEEDEGYGFTNY